MDGRDWTERDGPARPENESQKEVEDGAYGEIQDYRREEERPRRAPRVGVAPPEIDDRWVLGEPVRQRLGDHDSQSKR